MVKENPVVWCRCGVSWLALGSKPLEPVLNNTNNLFILHKFNIKFQMRITMYIRTNKLKER